MNFMVYVHLLSTFADSAIKTGIVESYLYNNDIERIVDLECLTTLPLVRSLLAYLVA